VIDPATQQPFPIIFLDMDDVVVLNRTSAFDKHRVHELAPDVCRKLIHPPAGLALTELLQELPAKIVVTSHWVRFTSRAAFERLLRLAGYEQIAMSLHDAWSAPRGSAVTRVEVIDAWLTQHHRSEPYCVIDDRDSGASLVGAVHDKAGRVLLCDVGVGLHRGHLPFIREALTTSPP
jgi:HAD domain in Swiss Army Knife RNA repair proteins